MVDIHDGRGVLYPARLPEFQRILPPEHLRQYVSWYWISRWDIAAGRISRQQILPFPLMNLVVQPEGVTVAGPSRGASHRDLRGTSWAVAALLRPAAAPYLASLVESTPQQLLDQEATIDAGALHQALLDEHQLGDNANSNAGCAHQLSLWLEQRLPPITESGELANNFLDHVSTNSAALRVDHVAKDLNLTVRSLQRLSLKYLGLSPLAVIRRYRLQEAALHLREHPQTSLASLAVDLGYADQAHLSTDFRKVLGYSPSDYRSS